MEAVTETENTKSGAFAPLFLLPKHGQSVRN